MQKKLSLIFGVAIASMFFLTNIFIAQATNGLPGYLRPENLPTLKGINEETPPEATTQARFLIGDIITVFLSIAGIIAVWAIVNNAFWLVVSIGKGEIIDQRRKALFWAIGGLILVILSYAIIRFVTEFIVGVAEQPVQGPATPGPGAGEVPAP